MNVVGVEFLMGSIGVAQNVRFTCATWVTALLLSTSVQAQHIGGEIGVLSVDLETVTVTVGTPTPTPTPTATVLVFCTPPACASDETLLCPDVCPGGCGHICATPTATPVPPACVGDCNEDGEVEIDELVAGTNVALGQGDMTSCAAFDASPLDGQVDVNELVAGVENAIEGCAPPIFYDCVAGEICSVEGAKCETNYYECCLGLPNEFTGYLYRCDCGDGYWSCLIFDPICVFEGCGD